MTRTLFDLTILNIDLIATPSNEVNIPNSSSRRNFYSLVYFSIISDKICQ